MDELALLDDATLVERVRDGVDAAFEVLWTRYYVSAFNYAKTRVGGRSFDAEEVVTDAYTRIWRSLHDGRGPSTNFRAYLYAAIRTVAWDRVLHSEQPLDAVDDVAAPQLAEPSHEDDMVARCFYALNERYRTVLWLSAVEGYKPAEIGEALGIDARHASVLIMRSKESFRKLYTGGTNDVGDDVNEDGTRGGPLPGVPQAAASRPKVTTALGRHLLGGVAGLTVAQAAVAGASWASAATIVSPPPMPASIMLAAGAAAVGGAAVASGAAGTGAGSGIAAGAGTASASTSAAGSSAASAGGSSGGSSGGASTGASTGAASGGASTTTMVVVGVAIVAVIGAAAFGISSLFKSGGPNNPVPPPAVTQPASTTAPPAPVTTPSSTTTTSEPSATETPSAAPTTQPPTSTKSTTQPPANPPATQAPVTTPPSTPPPTTPTLSVTPSVPWITDGSQCTGSDQWYGPWPSGPFTHCPTS